MKKIRVKHLILGFSIPLVIYAILGGFLGSVLARDTAYRYLSVFQDVVTLIMNNYLKPAEMDSVMNGAISGMMESLDPDSCYLTPEQFAAFQNPNARPQAEIGVEVNKRYYIQIVSVLPKSPAAEAGLEPGDLIKSIDGENTREINIIVGESMLRGPAGAKVKLEVIRGRQPDPVPIEVQRMDVVSSPVEFELMPDGVTGYMHINAFHAGTDIEVQRGLKMLTGKGATRILLDIRNSHGRIAEDGARVAELFVSGGIAARLQSRKGEQTDLILATDRVSFDGPVALVVNRATSGAAEILASAFASKKRGELVGVTTSGRSAVQKAIALGDGAGLVLSVAKYWTPDGKPLLGEGLSPTVEISGPTDPESEEDPMLDKALEILNEGVEKKAA